MSSRCECYGAIDRKNERYSLWKEIMGDDAPKVPLKHPLPFTTTFGVMYEGDPTRLTAKQRVRLIEVMSSKFNIPKSEVEGDVAKGVLPVKCDTISVCELHMRCML